MKQRELEQIGRRIAARRKELDMTQDMLAEICDLSPFYISQIERGVKLPSLYTFVALVNALDVSADDLLLSSFHNRHALKPSLLSSQLERLPWGRREYILQILEALLNS